MAGQGRATLSIAGFVVGLFAISEMATAQPGPQPVPAPVVGSGSVPLPAIPVAPQSVPPGGGGGPGPSDPGLLPPGSAGGPPSGFLVGSQPGSLPPAQRFNFKIDPNTPTKALLPTPPKAKPVTGPVLSDDLTKVPEAEFQARPEKISADGKLTEQTAYQLAKINHLNAKKTDAFMAALLESRPDLAGLPFTMGDDCRTSGERAKQFTQAVASVRQALGGNRIIVNFNTGQLGGGPIGPGGSSGPPSLPQSAIAANGPFWTQYSALCEQEDAARSPTDKALREQVTVARIAALMQMLAAESAEMRLGLVKYLTAVPHVEATKALAKLTIFSAEEDVRAAAIDSLKVRRERDYTDILVKGLRYPLPAVGKRSADAIAKIGRNDLVPELIAVLAADDPRMPAVKDIGNEKATFVREMVKINHHRNCMMCHAPGNPGTVSGNVLTAEVPIQGQPLPTPAEGYRQSSPDLMIRIDVTYLRQDFSALLPVSEAHPWPDAQRFDFFVRERKLTDEEADGYRDKLSPKEPGVLSPYHKAALAALRELTGKDTTPTAEAWRKLLKVPVKAVDDQAGKGGRSQ